VIMLDRPASERAAQSHGRDCRDLQTHAPAVAWVAPYAEW
jgi:hypothetical protein